MIAVRVEGSLHEALVAEASAEDRSMAKQLERILRERYGSALAEREPGSKEVATQLDSAGGVVPLGGESTESSASLALASPRSASADSKDEAGTNGKRTAALKAGAGPHPPSGKPQPKEFKPDFKGGKK